MQTGDQTYGDTLTVLTLEMKVLPILSGVKVGVFNVELKEGFNVGKPREISIYISLYGESD